MNRETVNGTVVVGTFHLNTKSLRIRVPVYKPTPFVRMRIGAIFTHRGRTYVKQT